MAMHQIAVKTLHKLQKPSIQEDTCKVLLTCCRYLIAAVLVNSAACQQHLTCIFLDSGLLYVSLATSASPVPRAHRTACHQN